MIHRFLWLAMGYWKGQTQRPAWVLSVGFLICLVVNTYMALAVNRWSKSFFDALQTHKVDEVTGGILQLAILAVGVGLASIATTQFRMRLQVNWRLWLTASLIEKWLVNESRQACAISPAIDNPEARIADDGRLAIELFVDLAGGVINIFLVSAAFILVLWQVGGSYEFLGVVIPGYLVLAVFVYSVVTSFCMWVLGRPLVASVEAKAAAEGNFRYALTRARHEFESRAVVEVDEDIDRDIGDYLRHPVVKGVPIIPDRLPEIDAQSGNPFDRFLFLLAATWGRVIQGQTKIVFLTHANNLLAPAVPLLLGAPKYLAGDLTLGDLMQAAAAFLQVQLSLNWLADNALSIANWSASARRVAALDLAIDTTREE
ncbi:SbmA/BacA-like family transporter [Methylocystis rosea]|uniref:SbmA/BacA-like family transporter n=1 Tax=Methylocystis rosea TaxID=173366 RepID=UPI0012EC56FF|nr:SbmA/BacA-like family transporter [Methylocystis rosea]